MKTITVMPALRASEVAAVEVAAKSPILRLAASDWLEYD
jgi:hypothetical protein